MPKVKKLPKWAIKKAGGINKKAWALARRGKGRRMSKAKPAKSPRRTPRRATGASHGSSHNNNNKKGWGSWFKTGRTVDIFTGPAQGSVSNHGFTQAGGMDALRRYSAGLSEGSFDSGSLRGTAGGIGTGLFRDWIRSKMGVYRGLGQKKILSGIMAANPEILATAESLPQDGIELWNRNRVIYDRSYDPLEHRWELSPRVASGIGGRFWQSVGLDVGLKVTQKVAERFINPMLPPGYNF